MQTCWGASVLVPGKSSVSLGASIFAFLAAGRFRTEEAQKNVCPSHKVYEPDPEAESVYGELYPLYQKLIYFEFGQPGKGSLGNILPALIQATDWVLLAGLRNSSVPPCFSRRTQQALLPDMVVVGGGFPG